MVAPLRVQYMYQSTQKNSGYVTANKKSKQFFLKIGKISLAVLRKFDTVVVSTKSIS